MIVVVTIAKGNSTKSSVLVFFTPSIKEVSLGPLGNTHHNKPCKHYD